MNSKWQINRVGLLDFWYYDEEEFDFLDGRMLLRGANGSGKSVTMQSFIPLLLDGNMRPERLDPFGSRARKMENYLLEEGDEREERTERPCDAGIPFWKDRYSCVYRCSSKRNRCG